jgi:O-antigen/teichoic acid export membrane protein
MMDRTLVGIMLGPSAVAVVEIASRLQDVVRLVLAASAQTVTTAAPYLRSRGARDRLQELVVFGTRVTTGVTLIAAATLAAVANEVLTVWTDGATAAAATAPLLFGLAYLSIEAPYQVIGNTLTGLGDMRRLLVASWIGVTVNLVATVVLIDLSGVVGAFQGTLAGSIATIGFLTPALVSTSGRSVGELLRRTIVPCLAPAIAAFGAAHAIVGLDLAPLTTLAVALPLAGVAAAMATWVVVLDDGERERFAALVAARRGVSDHLPG